MALDTSEPVQGKGTRVCAGFWARRQKFVRDVMLPYQWEALNDRVPDVAKSGAVANFRIAAGLSEGDHHGFVFQDSDLAKWLEAACYSLRNGGDSDLREIIRDAVDLIGKALEDDGYLNTRFTIADQDRRWQDLRDNHELYVSGHMLEAALAHARATGETEFLDLMVKNAEHIRLRFGAGPNQIPGYPGHPEIERALLALFDHSQDERWLSLAQFFVEQRGRLPGYFVEEAKRLNKSDIRGLDWYAVYTQSHKPIREQTEAVGHAVRAGYLFAAVAELARRTRDEGLSDAVRRVWSSAVARRMYLTGGIGSTWNGEAFTSDYDLPNEAGYAETCAAIALVMWAREMLLLESRGEYGDVMERALYNGVLSGVAADGRSYSYRNPLAFAPGSRMIEKPIRRGWHECACCPPNLARLIASIHEYVYSCSPDQLFVNLFVDSEVQVVLGGSKVLVRQQTDYPQSGEIAVRVQTGSDTVFKLALRIPEWSDLSRLAVNGSPVELDSVTEVGFAVLEHTWRDGDLVELSLSLQPRRVYSHPHIRYNAGCVALCRGPEVYCIEEADNGPMLHEIVLPTDTELRLDWREIGGETVPVIEATAHRLTAVDQGTLYGKRRALEACPVDLTAIPYRLWGNRGLGEMRVWIRES